MTSEAAWTPSEGYSGSHVWACSSFTTASTRRSLQCFTARKTNAHQKEPKENDLCERKDGQRRWPLRASPVDPNFFDDCRFMEMLYLSHLLGTARARGENEVFLSEFGTIYTPAGCGHASLCPEWDGSDPCSHESMDDKGINRVRCGATLWLLCYRTMHVSTWFRAPVFRTLITLAGLGFIQFCL